MTIFAKDAKETQDNVPLMKGMVADGTIDLQEYRDFYRAQFSRDTTLTDEQLTVMCARSDDDMDPDEWARFMAEIEKEEAVPFRQNAAGNYE